MGEAKRRGTYEQRKLEGVAKNVEKLAQAQIRLQIREKERISLWNKLSDSEKTFTLLSVGVQPEILVNMGMLTISEEGEFSVTDSLKDIPEDSKLLETASKKIQIAQEVQQTLTKFDTPSFSGPVEALE